MSDFLENALKNLNSTQNFKTVFVDIVSYSKRRSQSQATVIRSFMNCLSEALKATSAEYVDYAEKNNLNFSSDVICIPTGDGAVICFPFEGLHDVHLFFAKRLLNEIKSLMSAESCDRFDEQNWCNCHSYFSLRIGISEGKTILYKDLNDNYNVAGNSINMAARVMNYADSNQIIFTGDAFNQFIDMADDPLIDEKFKKFENINVKHNVKLDLYQYVDQGCNYLNSNEPSDLSYRERMNDAMIKMSPFGIPSFDNQKFEKEQLVELMEGLGTVMNGIAKIEGE